MATVTYNWQATTVADFLNNSNTTGNQNDPAIASNGTTYFGTWDATPTDEFVSGRVVNSAGTPLAGEFQVNTTITNDQFDSSIAALNNNNYVVTFTDQSNFAVNSNDIRARLFTSNGTAVDLDFGAAAVSNNDFDSDVAGLADGGFAVSWTRDFGAGDNDTRMAIFNADGSVRNSFVVVASNAQSSTASSVAGLSGGNIVVAWQEEPAAGGNDAVYFRRFTADGTDLGGPVLIDSVGSINADIQVVGLDDGGFAVAYTDNGWGISGTEITFLIFNADGGTRTPFIRANNVAFGGNETGNQNLPTITTLENGMIVVGWTDANTGNLMHQAFDANGNAAGSNYAAQSEVIEGEIAGLTGGLVANVRQSSFPDAGGDNSIRHSVHELTRTTTGDGTSEFLTGDILRDFMNGGGGDDTLKGGGGADTLNGGAGDDVLIGGDADDVVLGGAGNDRMIWNPGDDTDLFEGGDGSDTAEVNGGNGAEVFTVADNGTRVRFDRVNPAPFSLDIGTTESLVVNMNGGDDSFSATGNLAALIGITVDGGAGNDTILGSNGIDLLLGGDGNDFIDGQQGNDTAFLGAGNDTFQWDPGDGSDVVEGQAGIDVLDFNGSNASENIDIAANGARVRFFRDLGAITMDLNDVETIAFDANGGADNIVVGDLTGTDATRVDVNLAASGGGGDSQADTVTVNATNGADVIDVFGAGTSASVVGLAAQVNITNLEGANDALIIHGLGGNDSINATTLPAGIVRLTIDGGAGDDTLLGSQGADIFLGGAGNDTLLGGADLDTLRGGAGVDLLYGEAGNDVIQADIDTDYAFGGAGNDQIFSGATNAILVDGEAGNDIITTGSGIDYLYGGADDDTISGGGSGDLITGNAGNDQILGGEGIDYLYGEDGNDVINGGDTADFITGMAGNDTVSGGLGSDYMWGDAGFDFFDLRQDLNAGDFDYIGDLGVSVDTIVLPSGYAAYTTYFQQGGDVIGSVALGAGTYNFWVDGGATPLTVAQVEAQTWFI